MIRQDKSIKFEWGKKTLIFIGLNYPIIMLTFIIIKLKLWFWNVLHMLYSMTEVFSYVFLMAGWWDKGKSIQLHSLWNGTVSANKRWRDSQGPKPPSPGNSKEPWWNEEGLYRQGQEDWHNLSSLLPISLFDF